MMKKMNLLKKIFAGFTTWQLLIAMVVPIMVPNVATADDTGFKNPAANINTGWVLPTASYNSDNTWYAVADSGSDVVQYKSFNFNIPVGAAIDGVEVAVEGFTLGLGSRQADVSLSWNAGTNWTSSVTTNMPRIIQGEASKVYGSSINLWGRAAWNYNDFNNTNFSLKVDANNATMSSLNIDSVAVKVFYTPDTQKPIAAVTSPSVNSNIRGGFTVCGTSSDNSAVANLKVRFQDPSNWGYINNGFSVTPDVAGNWCLDVNGLSGNNVSDGVWGIRLLVTDIAGNSNNNLKFSPFILDNILPTGSITTPVNGTYSNNGFVRVAGVVSDENSGADYVQLKARTIEKKTNGARIAETGWTVATLDEYGNYEGIVDISGLPERADYEICAVVYDKAGNNKWLWPRPVITFDKTPPASTFDSKLDVLNPTNDNNPDVAGKYNGVDMEETLAISSVSLVTDIDNIIVVYKPSNVSQEEGLAKGFVGYYYKEGEMDGAGNYITNDEDMFNVGLPLNISSVKFFLQNGAVSVLPDGEYIVETWAYDRAGNITVEEITKANNLVIDTVAPETPLNLTVTGQTDDTVSLKWNTSTDDRTGITGYKIYWGTTPGTYTNNLSVGNVTEYTISSLSPDTQYYFVVTALDGATNESEKSMEVAGKTNAETFNFNVLTPIVLTAATPGEITGGDVLGAVDENQEPKKEVKGTEDNKDESEDESSGAFLGLMWYWWILILAGLGISYWWFIGGRRRKDEK